MSSVRREASTRAAPKPVSQTRPTLRLVGSFKKAVSRVAHRRRSDPFVHPLAFAPRNAGPAGESIDGARVIARIISAVQPA